MVVAGRYDTCVHKAWFPLLQGPWGLLRAWAGTESQTAGQRRTLHAGAEKPWLAESWCCAQSQSRPWPGLEQWNVRLVSAVFALHRRGIRNGGLRKRWFARSVDCARLSPFSVAVAAVVSWAECVQLHVFSLKGNLDHTQQKASCHKTSFPDAFDRDHSRHSVTT